MRLHRSSHVDSEQQSSSKSDLTIGHLAHELNSLLDGSLRCLSLAQRSLGESSIGDASEQSAIIEKIEIAQSAMRRMGAMLNRAMHGNPSGLQLFTEQESLGDQVKQIVEMLKPMASEHHVQIESNLTPRAAALPAMTLTPIILNSLRNAIEACARGKTVERRVELSMAITPGGQLQILVADSGPGAPCDPPEHDAHPRDGHGFGLDLCSRIATDLGGTLSLTNVPFGDGAILQVNIPMRSLANHG